MTRTEILQSYVYNNPVYLKHQSCAAIQRELDSPEKWADRMLIEFNKGNAKSCIWGGRTPCIRHAGGWLVRKQLCTDEPGSSDGQQNWTRTSNVPLQQRLLTASWAAIARALLASQARWTFSTHHCLDPIWALGPALVSPAQERDGLTAASPARGN